MTKVSEAASADTPFRQYVGPILAMVAAFVVYYCMYAFRKPFAAATWEGAFLGSAIQMKTALVVSQIVGYALAKLIGTRVCSGIRYDRIVFVLFGCILCALASLFSLPFAGDFKFVAMFFNGLSLGMIWGFVMRPLEGRAMTEMLMAGLCVSFIIASGDVKSTGRWLTETEFFAANFGGDVTWMPFLTATMYLPFLVVAAIVLFWLPRPTNTDRLTRSERRSMASNDRRAFLKHHLVLLVPLGITYFLLTAYRDFRDNFQAEIFASLGIVDSSAFSTTERYVAFGVVAVLSIFIFIKNSRSALVVCHWVMAGGLIFCGVATWMLKAEMLSGYWWMVLAGVGAYICYIAFHCIVFERMVAYSRAPGNAVFAMMIFDFVGYVAAIMFMIAKDLFNIFNNSNHLDVLVTFTWLLTLVGAGAIFVSLYSVRHLNVFDETDTRASAVGK